MKERIIEIMEKEHLSSARFAETIGIQRSALSHILNERNKPSLDVLMKILERFNYIDSDWLLFGKGTMVRSGSGKPVFQSGLFDENEKNSHARTPERKYNKEEEIKEVKKNILSIETPEKEVVILKPPPQRSVSKIVLFYSDNTFETFISEEVKK